MYKSNFNDFLFTSPWHARERWEENENSNIKSFFRVLLTTHQRQTRVQIFYGISSFASLPIPGVYKYIKLPTPSSWTVQGYSGDGMLKEGSEWSKEIPRAKLLTNISTDDLWGVKTFQHITHDSLVTLVTLTSKQWSVGDVRGLWVLATQFMWVPRVTFLASNVLTLICGNKEEFRNPIVCWAIKHRRNFSSKYLIINSKSHIISHELSRIPIFSSGDLHILLHPGLVY